MLSTYKGFLFKITPRLFYRIQFEILNIIICIFTFSIFSGTLSAQQVENLIDVKIPTDSRAVRVDVKVDQWVIAGDTLAVFKDSKGIKFTFRAGISGRIIFWELEPLEYYEKGELIGIIKTVPVITEEVASSSSATVLPELDRMLSKLFDSTGLASILRGQSLDWTEGLGRLIMIVAGLFLLYLGIKLKFEPLLLVPIGFGSVLSNIPSAGLSEPGGILYYVYEVGITTGIFPLIIFMGVGAMTDFGPMLANPKTSLLGGAAQFGIFGTLLGALALNNIPGIDFSLRDAASIGIIGGADGPTAIFLASQLSPHLLGSVAIAAYSYMALVPIIQPPIMRVLTSQKEREIEMTQLRYVSTREKILFPLIVLGMCAILLPSAAPLIGMFMFGNLAKECGVIDRLSDTIQKSLINTVTIFLGLSIGSKLAAREFLNLETVGIIILGMIAFSAGTATGVLMAKLMNKISSTPVNPLIGAAGVSAVPMAARVVNQVGLEANSQNHLLMHAMGPNVSGVIGSAVSAGVLLAML